jgi:hypothetical protein
VLGQSRDNASERQLLQKVAERIVEANEKFASKMLTGGHVAEFKDGVKKIPLESKNISLSALERSASTSSVDVPRSTDLI